MARPHPIRRTPLNGVLSAGVRKGEQGSAGGRSWRENGQRLRVVPGHPLRGFAGEPIGVPMQDGEIHERIDVGKLTRVDQAHEQIADASATLGFIEQRISAMQNGFLQGALHNGAVERGAGNAQEQSQWVP